MPNLNKQQIEAGVKSLSAHVADLAPGESYAIAEKMGDPAYIKDITESLEKLSNRGRSAMARAKHSMGGEFQGEHGTYRAAKTHDTICVFTITRIV